MCQPCHAEAYSGICIVPGREKGGRGFTALCGAIRLKSGLLRKSVAKSGGVGPSPVLGGPPRRDPPSLSSYAKASADKKLRQTKERRAGA